MAVTSEIALGGKKVLVLVGPTASGKTDISLHLAHRLHGEIISADSRQVFRHLDIGTAKPSRALLQEIPHHFVDTLTPDRDFNAGEFGIQGRKVLADIFRRKKTPIVVGGSGLYVRSLIDGFFEGPGADREYRELLEREIAAGRVQRLIDELRRVDPASARSADPTKPRRIIRALEVYHMTGKPLSEHHREGGTVIGFVPVQFGLSWPRKVLYERINERCEEMITAGLLREVEKLEMQGYDGTMNALNTVGYAESFAFRRGEYSFEEMIRLFKQNSRRYAKRQLTWFRKDGRIRWIEMDESGSREEVVDEILRLFESS